jgi:hypothetical protein
MYDELVKRLRNEAETERYLLPHSDNGTAALLDEAANAIEELSAYARQMANLKKDGWYLQKAKMMTYGQATMTRPLPEPPKEE